MPKQVRVFVAYAREDFDAAQSIVGDFRLSGLEVSWDKDMPAGVEWDDYLKAKIRNADFFVWVMSPASVRSTYVTAEFGFARAVGAQVRVVHLGGVAPKDAHEAVRAIQWTDVGRLSPLVASIAGQSSRAGSSVVSGAALALSALALMGVDLWPVEASAEGKPITGPVGTVVAWPGSLSSMPEKWRLCDGKSFQGANVPREQWRELKDILESDTLPDYRGYFLRGQGQAHDGNGKVLEGRLSGRLGELQRDMIQDHQHGIPVAPGRSGGTAETSALQSTGPNPMEHTGHVLPDVAGVSVGPETRPVNKAVHWIIRVQ